MTSNEKEEVLKSLTEQRNDLLQTMNEARQMRAELILKNRDKQVDFLQKLGELSFTFGAAIVPVIIIAHSGDKINYVQYVFVAVALYMINGFLSLWQVKARLEQDADNTPFVGLDEELITYPVINSLSKLLNDPENKKYQKEYLNDANNAITLGSSDNIVTKSRVNLWFDIVILNFIFASLFMIRAVWSYAATTYWTIFSFIILLMTVFIILSYARIIKNQSVLQDKTEKLRKIKADYQEWLFKDKIDKR